MPREAVPELAGPDAYLAAVRGQSSTDLRERFRGDPVALAEEFGLILPPKPVRVMVELGILSEEEAVERFGADSLLPGLRELVEDVCLLRVHDAAAVANRGGGKSKGVSFIEFYVVFVLDFDALNMGGSELQADNVYQYLLQYLDHHQYWKRLVKGEAMRERTFTINNAWIRVLTASQKSVRSPHAGGKKKDGREAGGLLVIDEEAEADPDIVSAALPTINTAMPSVNVRCSTFHNATGSFAELIDDHVAMGYKLYKWDIFDTCERCTCVGSCQSQEPCFREDHIEHYVNPDTGEEEEHVLHRAYCGGKAMYATGWIPIAEIVKLWKRLKRNHAKFEVEAMGSRPTSSGYVIKDQLAYSNNIVDMSPAEAYQPGGNVTVCVDWGSVNAAISVWQEQTSGKLVRLHSDLIEETGLTEMISVILGYANYYLNELLEIAADIGGGGSYNNQLLRERGFTVRDVNFGEEKELGAAAWNIFNESGSTVYLAEQEDAHFQVRRWRRNSAGRIEKGKDHLCDADICFFTKFASVLQLHKSRVGGVGFSTGRQEDASVRVGPQPNSAGTRPNGVPILARPIVATPKRRR